MSLEDEFADQPARPGDPGHWTWADRLRDDGFRDASSRAEYTPELNEGVTRLVMRTTRHIAHLVTTSTKTAEFNSVAEPWIPYRTDLDRVFAGHGAKLDEPYVLNGRLRTGSLFAINGRVYVVQRNGHAFPFRGPGIHTLTRDEFDVLIELISQSDGAGSASIELATRPLKEVGSEHRVDFVVRLARYARRWR